MKQWFLAISILAFALLFVLIAAAMHTGAVQGIREEFPLSLAMSLFLFGPLSILMLAVCAFMIRIAYEHEVYQKSKPYIRALAALQLVSMFVYLVLVWRVR